MALVQHVFAAVGLLCLPVALAGCAPQGAETPAATPPAYLDKVDSDGLIDGKTPSQLMGEMIFACMQDAGWNNLVLDPDGSFGGNIPPEQADKYDADQAVCDAEREKVYPTTPMSDRAIRERYALELETRQCLIEQGYSISEPPSEQTWLEQFRNATTGLWLPYWEVFSKTEITAAEVAALQIKCPDPANKFYAD